MLATLHHGEASDAPPLLIAHGLFGSARNWNAIAKRLSDRGEVVVPDMRNHGSSPWSDTHSYPDMAEDLAGIVEKTADIVGHSMGGKAAMALALMHPRKVRRLIVADIAPVSYDHSQQVYIDAMKGVDLAGISARGDADALLKDAVPEAGIRAFLLQSLDVERKAWRLNLDALSAQMDGIVGWPRIDGRFQGPTLFLSGGDSDYVARDHRPIIKHLFPNAKFAAIPGAGHWLHAEKPREVEAAIRAFLDA